MAVKKFKPTTPSNRFTILNTFAEITKSTPEKSLLASKSSTGGRNSAGEMTMRYRGGGHKKHYRIIDFKRNKNVVPAKVASVEYDPNRTAFIALLHYADGEKRYIIAPQGIKVGSTIVSGTGVSPDLGNALPIGEMPLGTTIHNIETQPGKGGSFARSAGTYATLAAKEGKYCTIKMPSGETRLILSTCTATVGAVSNPDHSLQSFGKAGRSRWKGIRPRTRPVAMNPVDHPMGGGEGRASGGHPRSRKGLKAKGAKTRTPKNPTNKFIISRRKTVNNQQ
jgi:large subunit ribosomal protein L2